LEVEKASADRRFKLGVVLIIGSTLCGYASLATLGGAAEADDPWLRDVSLLVWFLTWIPFLAGVVLSGKEGYRYAKRLIGEHLFGRKDV
jgi:hypothetical protein